MKIILTALAGVVAVPVAAYVAYKIYVYRNV